MCSIDLSRYNDYERRGAAVYAFRYDCIASEVVKRVEKVAGFTRQRSKKPEKQNDSKSELTDVALTFSSGRAGITYWINSYLKLSGSDRICEDHKAVENIRQWLEAQVSAGRFGEVPDDEMLEQVQKYLEID